MRSVSWVWGISSCSHQFARPRSQTEIDQSASYCLSAFLHVVLPESHIASMSTLRCLTHVEICLLFTSSYCFVCSVSRSTSDVWSFRWKPSREGDNFKSVIRGHPHLPPETAVHVCVQMIGVPVNLLHVGAILLCFLCLLSLDRKYLWLGGSLTQPPSLRGVISLGCLNNTEVQRRGTVN